MLLISSAQLKQARVRPDLPSVEFLLHGQLPGRLTTELAGHEHPRQWGPSRPLRFAGPTGISHHLLLHRSRRSINQCRVVGILRIWPQDRSAISLREE